MRRVLSLSIVAALLCTAGSAFAFGKFGARLGYGFVAHVDEADAPDSSSNLVLGGAWLFDAIPMLELEVDLLYRRSTAEYGKLETTAGHISIPALAKFSLPVVPMFFSLQAGAGLEPRFVISAEAGGTDVKDNLNTMVMYLPIVLGGTIDLQIIQLNLEMRYERQLTEAADKPDVRSHELTFLAGVFF